MKTNAKLISAALMLAISVVMLAGASMAWFTVSTAPEITGFQVSLYTDLDLQVSKDGPDRGFSQSVSTGQVTTPDREESVPEETYENPNSIDDLGKYAPLKPISTVDGINWYKPTYDAVGYIQPLEDFIHTTAEANGNVVLDEALQGTNAYFDANNRGYFIYADVWLKTENKDGVAVSISVPDITENTNRETKLQPWERGEGDYGELHGNKYGTYALGKYTKVGEKTVRIDNNVQTALRIGFQELGENDAPVGKFYIYEPNANQRSNIGKKPKTSEHHYIMYGENQTAADLVEEGSVYYKTQPIGPNPETGAEDDPTLREIPQDQLLVQLKSEWGESITTNYAAPTSADVKTFGKFMNTASLYQALGNDLSVNLNAEDSPVLYDLSSENTIVDLEPDAPKKLRIFFWLEGQDVDCWNDIASGSFLVNLEFAARPTTTPQT